MMNPDIIRTSYFKYRDLLHADSNTNPATISLTEQPRLASYQKGWINEEDNAYVCGPNTFIGNINCTSTKLMHQWNYGTIPTILHEKSSQVNCLLDLKGIPSYRNLLCLGLDYGQEGLICVLSCEGSVVLGAILCPTPVQSMCVIDSGIPGSPCLNIHPELRKTSGLIAVGLKCGRVLMLDLRRNDEVAWLAKDGAEPSDMMICDVFEYDKIEHLRVLVKTKIEMHLAFELFGLKHCFDNRTSVKSLLFCPKLFSLIVGFDAGFFEIWNLNTMELVQRSDTVDGPITRLVLQFPEDDPRHVCYLWAVEEAPDTFPQANMYCITCEERNVTPKYGVLYKGVGSVTLAHTFIMNYEHIDTYTAGKCLSAYNVHSPTVMTTEKSLEQTDESNKSDQIESLSPNDNLCSFTWIMWDEKGENHSQGFALFDLSVWYKLHMPTDTSHYYLMGGINYSIAVTHLQQLADYPDDVLLDARIVATSIKHFSSVTATEESSYPSALTFDVICLLQHSIIHLRHIGVQNHELQKFDILEPLQLASPWKIHRAFSEAHMKPMCDKDYSLKGAEFVLSIALEHGFDGFLKRCATSWADGEHAAAGLSLTFFMDWAWKMAKLLKLTVEDLVCHLFNGSGVSLDKQSYRLLSHCKIQYEDLQNLLKYLLQQNFVTSLEAVQETKQRSHVLELLKLYVDAILCVATHRLLPEPEPTANAQSLYPIEKFIAECQERRQAQSDQGSILIDVLVESCGSELHNLWRSEGGTGFYPPPTIRAFVHTFLLASVPTDIKHEIGVYFYMDVASLIEKHQPKTINVEQLRVYPSARPSIVKLAQAMWHLDHKEFKNACKILETPSIQATDFQPWKNHIMSTLALSDQLGMAVHLLSKQNSEESTVESLNIECEIWVKHGRISEAFCNLKMILELEQKNNPVTSADDREAVFKDRLSAFFKDVFHEGYVKNLMEQPLEYGEQELLKDVLDKENPNLCYVYLLVKNRMSDAQKFLTERNISKTLRVLCHQLSDNLTEVITRVMQLPVQNESVSLTCKDGREKRHLTPALQRIAKETLSTPSNINQSDGPTSPKYPFCEAYAKSTHKDIKEAVSAMTLRITSKEALKMLNSPYIALKTDPTITEATPTAKKHSILKNPKTSDKSQSFGRDSSSVPGADCTKQIRFKSDTEDETWESITTNPDNNSSAIPPSTSSESSSSTADDKPVPSRRFSQHRWQQGKLKYHHEILPKKSSGSSVLSPSIGSEAEVHTMESQYGQIHHFQSSPCYSPRSPPRPSSPCYPPVTPAHNFQSSAFYSRMSPPHNLPSSPNYSPRSPPLRVKSRNLPNKAASFSPREGSSLGSTSDNPSTSKISPGKDSPTKNAQPADVPSDNERGVKERSVNDALNVKGACSDSSKNEDPKPSSGLEQKDLAVDKIGDSPIKSSVKLHQKGDAEADSTSHSCKSVSSSLENKDGVEESDSASHSVKTDTKTSPGSLENKGGDEESHSASHSVKTETKRAPSSQKIKDVDSAACEPGDQDDSQDTIIAPFCPRTDTPQSLEKVNDSSSDDCIVLGSSTDDDSPAGENEAPQENEDRENKVSGNEETDDEESSNSSDEASTDSNIEEDTSAEESKDEAESVNVNSSDDEPSSSSTPDADSCDEESHEETESVKPNDDFRETSDVPEASVNDETNKETESANPNTSDSGDANSENEEIPEDSSVANNEEPKSTSTIAASKTEQIPAGSECDKSKTDTQDSATLQVFFEHESPTSDLDITLHCSESLNSNENAPAVLAETPQLDTTIEAEPSGSGPEKCSASNKKSIPGNSSSVEEHNQSSNESYDALGERRMTRSQLKLRSQHCPLPIHTESIDCDTTTSLAPEKSTASTDDEPPRKVRRSSRISSTKRDSSADSTSRASLPKRARRRDSVTGDDSMSVTSNVSRRTSISESSSHYATRSVTAQTGREEFAELIHTPRSRRQSASSTSTVHSTKSIGKDD